MTPPQRTSEIRPGNLELRAVVCVRAVGALTHGAVVHQPQHLEDPELTTEVTGLVVRYLADAPDAPTLANQP